MKLLKIYFLTALILACLTFFAAGAVAVDENAKKISMGEEIPVIQLNDGDNFYFKKFVFS